MQVLRVLLPTLCRLSAFVAAATAAVVINATVVAAAGKQYEDDNNPEKRIVAKTVKAHSIISIPPLRDRPD